MIFWQLFVSMFQIGLFSIGGGYAALPLIQEQIVRLHGWLTAGEFTDVVTIAEMTPGPIAINAATFVGIRVAGIPGALVATLGCVLPSCVIVILLAKIYQRYRSLAVMRDILTGLRPAVVAMIASAGISILMTALFTGGMLPRALGDVDFKALALFAEGLCLLRVKKLNPLYIIGGAGLLGLFLYGF